MKKHTGKLNLSKRTISNLDPNRMNTIAGGAKTKGNTCNNSILTNCGKNCGGDGTFIQN